MAEIRRNRNIEKCRNQKVENLRNRETVKHTNTGIELIKHMRNIIRISRTQVENIKNRYLLFFTLLQQNTKVFDEKYFEVSVLWLK